MSTSVNKVILVGNLGKDPIVGTTNSGEHIVNLSLATSECWKDNVSGEKKERTEWHKIVIFNDILANLILNSAVKKGSRVYIEGKLQTRKWTDNSSVEHYTTEVVISKYNGTLILCDIKNTSSHTGGAPFTENYHTTVDKAVPLDHEDIPF